MKKFSSFCYFALLNGVNLAVLYVTMVRVIMEFNFNRDIRILNLFICKTHVFLTYFLSHLSSFLLCTISVDRVISVMFLDKAKLLCTPRIAFKVSTVLVIFNFFLSSHILIFQSGHYETSAIDGIHDGIKNHNGSGDVAKVVSRVVCQSIQGTFYNDMIVQNIWKIVDMGIYAFLPFIVMFVCCKKLLLKFISTKN